VLIQRNSSADATERTLTGIGSAPPYAARRTSMVGMTFASAAEYTGRPLIGLLSIMASAPRRWVGADFLAVVLIEFMNLVIVTFPNFGSGSIHAFSHGDETSGVYDYLDASRRIRTTRCGSDARVGGRRGDVVSARRASPYGLPRIMTTECS